MKSQFEKRKERLLRGDLTKEIRGGKAASPIITRDGNQMITVVSLYSRLIGTYSLVHVIDSPQRVSYWYGIINIPWLMKMAEYSTSGPI